MGCIIGAHSPSRSACKQTCMDTRARQPPPQSDQWICEFHFAPTNQTFDMCGKCPAGCAACPFCGVRVYDYECEQGCDFAFGCTAP